MLINNPRISVYFAGKPPAKNDKTKEDLGSNVPMQDGGDSFSSSAKLEALPIDPADKKFLLDNSARISSELAQILAAQRSKTPVLEGDMLVNLTKGKSAFLGQVPQELHKWVVANRSQEVSMPGFFQSNEASRKKKISAQAIAEAYNLALAEIGDETIHSDKVYNGPHDKRSMPFHYTFILRPPVGYVRPSERPKQSENN